MNGFKAFPVTVQEQRVALSRVVGNYSMPLYSEILNKMSLRGTPINGVNATRWAIREGVDDILGTQMSKRGIYESRP